MPLSQEVSLKRNRKITLSTRLLGVQMSAFEALAAEQEKTTAGLLRELILNALSKAKEPVCPDPLLSEVIGVRLLLVNLLKPRDAGQTPLTAVAFDSLLDEIKKVKTRIALDIQRETTGAAIR